MLTLAAVIAANDAVVFIAAFLVGRSFERSRDQDENPLPAPPLHRRTVAAKGLRKPKIRDDQAALAVERGER